MKKTKIELKLLCKCDSVLYGHTSKIYSGISICDSEDLSVRSTFYKIGFSSSDSSNFYTPYKIFNN